MILQIISRTAFREKWGKTTGKRKKKSGMACDEELLRDAGFVVGEDSSNAEKGASLTVSIKK